MSNIAVPSRERLSAWHEDRGGSCDKRLIGRRVLLLQLSRAVLQPSHAAATSFPCYSGSILMLPLQLSCGGAAAAAFLFCCCGLPVLQLQHSYAAAAAFMFAC
jgi:hypothetical protein